MHTSTSRRSRRPMLLAAVAGAASIASVAQAQTAWSAAVSGSWTDPARWTAGVPANNAVTLGLVGPYTATLQNSLSTASSLTINNSAAVLSIFDNAQLLVGNVSNAGLIQISGPGAPGNNTRLAAAGNITISGTGTLRLAGLGNGDNDTAYLTYAAPANVITNAAGHSIAGAGRVYASLTNNGSVIADQSGKVLIFVEQPATNNSTMSASNGGALQFRGVSLTQSATGVCVSGAAANSNIQFVNASVSGGTLNGAGGSSGVYSFGSTTYNGVTLQNLNAVTDNSLLNVGSAGVVNNGTWTVSDPGAPGNNARIQAAAAAVTISGTGSIRLQGPSGGNGDNDTAYLYYTAPTNVLTNAAGHSIRGYGRVYTNLVNNGTVNADVAGKGIFMIDQPKTNNGTMTASNGGVLVFRSVTVTGNPTAQIISTDSASPVQMVNATMTGGGFTTSGTGLFQYFGSNTLSNLTVNGTHQITDNSLVNLATDLTNNGNWLISTPTAPGNLTRLQAAANVTINGTGTIRLQGNTPNGDSDSAYLYYVGSAANTLTLGANQQLLGYGRVYTNLINNGIINADNPNITTTNRRGIILMEQPKVNNATITSSNGGYWYIRGTTLTNNGTLTSANTTLPGGGFENCTVTGGTISNVSSQFFGTVGTVNLNGVTITPGSGVQINDNSLLVTTGLTNNGTIAVSTPGSPGNFTRLVAGAAASTLNGNGTLRLQGTGNGDNDSAYLIYTVPANQLVNGPSHTIAGYGRIYVNLVNNGTVRSDGLPGGLIFNDQPKQNNSVFEAVPASATVPGAIVIRTTINQSAAAVTRTVGIGQISLQNGSITGGLVQAPAPGIFRAQIGTNTISGITFSGVGQVEDNTNLVTPGFTNNGTMNIQTLGAPGNFTRITAANNANATISGTGTLRLQATGFGTDSSYLQGPTAAGQTLTLGQGQTLSGTGRLYYNITINGVISPDQPFNTPTNWGAIQHFGGSLALGPAATFNAQIRSTSAYDSMQGNSAITLSGGTINVSFDPAYVTNSGDLFDVMIGSSLTGQFATINVAQPPAYPAGPAHVSYRPDRVRVVMCYANCDGSDVAPRLNALDFSCFLTRYTAGDPYANCDGSTILPTLNALDFACFLGKFRTGCN